MTRGQPILAAIGCLAAYIATLPIVGAATHLRAIHLQVINPFDHVLKSRHGCKYSAKNIGVSGTTTDDWKEKYLSTLTSAAKDADLVWLTLMGNDAIFRMPECASAGKSAQECGDDLINNIMTPQLGGLRASRLNHL